VTSYQDTLLQLFAGIEPTGTMFQTINNKWNNLGIGIELYVICTCN